MSVTLNSYDDDQWHYSPDRALASLMGFMIVCSTMWGYQLHDRPVLDTLIQPSETFSSNYQRLSWRSRETRERNGRWILPTSTYRARRVLLHAVNLQYGTDGFTSPPKEGVLWILSPLKSIVLGRVWTCDLGSSGKHANHYNTDLNSYMQLYSDGGSEKFMQAVIRNINIHILTIKFQDI
jgi:hypothetical protein